MERSLHDARNAERILQMTTDTLILVAPDGVCVDISIHSNQWFLQEELLLGKNLLELLPESTVQKILPAFQEVVSEKKCISRNYRLDLDEGTYYFKCIMRPYDDKVLCQYRDITERSNLKLQLELMKQELEVEKNKAETSDHLKSAFLANMSHEIRTPLNAIVGFSRIIAESEDPEERKEYYEIVEANNERLLQLINEILDLSKIESGNVEFTVTPVKVYRLCKEIHDAHVFRCPAEVKLIFDHSDDALIIDSDKNRIFQVISNLIGNAFKFTTEGSISYGYRQEGDFVVFYVSDTGFGIQEDKVGKVFERFVRVNSFAQGTGLGLSICKTIIERLGGEISVVSEVGKGTTFSFTLPARKEEPEPVVTGGVSTSGVAMSGVSMSGVSTSGVSTIGVSTIGEVNACAVQPEAGSKNTARTQTSRASGQATILIAEDTDSNYELLKAILGREYHLERALDGMEAVALFEEVAPDLILMDIKMPNLDGLEATKIIRELSATVPIIIQSAYAFEHDRKMATEAGCNDFIAKPIAQNKLKEMIKKYVLPARGGAIQVGTDLI